jgi:RNA polymerase sigma factor (sigma-70 family)
MAGGAFTGVLQHLRRLAGRAGDASDAELLDRFVTHRDEAAFETLLARHGPMVWGVCRGLLDDVHEAEDAFAASFLVLVRRAGAIGQRERLASWLYGVAHRVARRARTNALRRQSRQREDVDMLPARPADDPATRERARLIHEELNRLPERYRLPLVLAYLEGQTQEEVARTLGWTPGAVRGRLERGRERLRGRLARRGLSLPAGVLAAVLTEQALAGPVPPALAASTLKAALALAAGGAAVSPSLVILVDGVVHAMFLSKVKVAAAVVLTLGVLTAGAGVVTYQTVTARQPDQQVQATPKVDPARLREAQLKAALRGDGDRQVEPPPVADLPPERVKALLAEAKGPMKDLLKEQFEAAQLETESRWGEFMAGRGTLDIAMHASQRLLQAELDLSSKKADQLAALEAHLKRMKEIEAVNQARFDAGRIPVQDLAQSRFNRVRAALQLERFKAGLPMNNLLGGP